MTVKDEQSIEPKMGAIIGRALSDKRFRSILYAKPGDAVKEFGLDATRELMELFRGLDDKKLVRLAERIDLRIEDPINQAIS